MPQNYDFGPLFGSTVGFDRVFDLLQSATRGEQKGDNYPPYDIERTGENAYRITVAVAGFTDADLSIEVKENALTLKGERKADATKRVEFLHQGIAARSFERRFQLADYVQVTGAVLENGLLHIDLVREIPEAKKPRQIQIATGRASEAPAIEGSVQQAA